MFCSSAVEIAVTIPSQHFRKIQKKYEINLKWLAVQCTLTHKQKTYGACHHPFSNGLPIGDKNRSVFPPYVVC
jgi:hypothetical protein